MLDNRFRLLSQRGCQQSGGITFFVLDKFDINRVLQELLTVGASSVPLLTDAARLALQKEAESYSYIPETGQVGTGDRVVRKQYSSFAEFPESSLYVQLAQAFQALMSEQLDKTDFYPFATPLNFNSIVLQKYEPGELGITAHRDSLRSINLVCIFNVAARGQFCLCEQRCGRNSLEFDSSPGNIIFLRAPGFLGVQERPFHYVTNIQVTRYSFGLRQRAFSGAGVEVISESSRAVISPGS